MRAESAFNLVSGALQSSLARAKKNYIFSRKKGSSKASEENKKGKKGKLVNRQLSAYCESIGSKFASYTSDQFLELGNSLVFEDGGFLERTLPSVLNKDYIILKQEVTLKKNGFYDKNSSKPTTSPATFVNGVSSIKKIKKRRKNKMGPENERNGDVSISTNGNGATTSSLQLPEPKRILFPKEKIQLGWLQKRGPGAGFVNFGNTCYLNSSLQALFHIPAFVNWILNDEEHRRKCDGTLPNQTICIICVVYVTLQEHGKNGGSIRPRVLDKLKAICKHFSYGRQEDAHEFLRYLLEGMERSYLTLMNGLRFDNRTKETNPLGQIFGGYIRTEVTCCLCGFVSTTFQPSAELQLDIRHTTTLEDALQSHFRKEKLDNNDYKCEKCRTVSQATKQFSLELPPLVLCLQLKRFTLYGNKISKRIHCNKILNMSRYLHKSRKTTGFYQDHELKYRLVALVTHLGQSPNCGHYTAIAEGYNGSYYQFDDQFVQEVSTQHALNNDAYVIIYEMEKSSQQPPKGGHATASAAYFSSTFSLKQPSVATAGPALPAVVNGNSSAPRKFAIPFAKSNVTNRPTNPPLKTNIVTNGSNGITKPKANGHSSNTEVIRFGIPQSSLMKNSPSPMKITCLQPGLALTNSARLQSRNPSPPRSTNGDIPNKEEEKIAPNKLERTEKVLGWDVSDSALSNSIDDDRKKHSNKTRDDSDEELDSGKAKKRRKSKSPSRENEDTNKLQTPQDKKFIVSKLSTILDGYEEGLKDHHNVTPPSAKKPRERKNDDNHSPQKLDPKPSPNSDYDRNRHFSSYSGSSYRNNNNNRRGFNNRYNNGNRNCNYDNNSNKGWKEKFDPNKLERRGKVLGWNGSDSALSNSIDDDRKRHWDKTRDDFDEELDSGKAKKRRKSKSPSRENEDANKFQTLQDKKDKKSIVSQWSNILDGYGEGFKDHHNVTPPSAKKPRDRKFDDNHSPQKFGPKTNPNSDYDRNRHFSSYSGSSYRNNNNNRRRFNNRYNNGNRNRNYDNNSNKGWKEKFNSKKLDRRGKGWNDSGSALPNSNDDDRKKHWDKTRDFDEADSGKVKKRRKSKSPSI